MSSKSKNMVFKADAVITSSSSSISLENQFVSTQGIRSLPETDQTGKLKFGDEVFVEIFEPNSKKLISKTKAVVCLHHTPEKTIVGLNFLPDSLQLTQLSAFLGKNGIYPTWYVRRFPRLAPNSSMNFFPTQSVVYWGKSLDSILEVENLASCEIEELGLNGCTLDSTNPALKRLFPNQKLFVFIEPKNEHQSTICFESTISFKTEIPLINSTTFILGIKFENGVGLAVHNLATLFQIVVDGEK